jgi:nitrite reductase/ring-hydroxylating ferredoxin subunit
LRTRRSRSATWSTQLGPASAIGTRSRLGCTNGLDWAEAVSYRRAAGVSRAEAAPAPADWTEIQTDGELTHDQPTLAHLDGEPLAAAHGDDGPVALFDRCSHLGGPLHEGVLVDGCVRCPWHGSTFRMEDGAVVRGPATAPQPAYELRVDGEHIQARTRSPH